MVNDEMLKKLKSQYIGVEVPDDEKMKLNEVLEYAKIDKKRKRKKVIIARWMISVAALLLVVIMPNTNETLASSLKNIPLVGNIFSVITVRKYDEDKNIKINMAKIDSNGDIKNKKTVEKLNNDIKKYTNKIVNQYKVDLGSSGFSDLYMDYKIVINNDKWFTIAFTINETRASGYEFHRYYNIDKSSGKIVSLKDIFKEKSDYIKIISNDIKRQMKQQMLTKDVVYFIKDNGISTGFKEISGNQNYYINNEGNIVIAFDEYEVGPGCTGAPKFVISKDIVKKILNN